MYWDKLWAPKAILRQRKAECITLSIFKMYYKMVEIKTLWFWDKSKHTDQCTAKRIRMSPDTCCQLIFDNRATNTQQIKESVFIKWCWAHCIPTRGRKKSEHYLTPYPNIITNGNANVNVTLESRKFLEKILELFINLLLSFMGHKYNHYSYLTYTLC